MQIIPLQSGSNGNSIYVETDGVRLLFDAGISGSKVKQRLAQYDRDVESVDAVLISHDHSDHARSMGIFHRKFDLPIYVTNKTYQAANRYGLGEIEDLRFFCSGNTLCFGNVRVETIATPHDGVDGVVFVIDDGKHRLGILTDLGHVFAELEDIIKSLDAVLLESNYDPEMLDTGQYPEWLKRRIKGPGGHISNIEAAEILQTTTSPKMKWACLAHLSQENNSPKKAMVTHRRILGDGFPLYVASRENATAMLEL